MDTLSPVQKFAALAVARGDIVTAFHESGLRSAMDNMFRRYPHEKLYYSEARADESSHVRLSDSPDPVPAQWKNGIDTLYLAGRPVAGNGTVFSLNRSRILVGTECWHYMLCCETSGDFSRLDCGLIWSVKGNADATKLEFQARSQDGIAAGPFDPLADLALLDKALNGTFRPVRLKNPIIQL